MPAQATENLFSRINEKMVNGLIFVAIWALAAMMFLTFADVLLRYMFNSPIPGATELIEFLMAIAIPFSLVFCAKKKSHIGVDFVIEGLSKRVRKIIEIFNNLLMVVLFIPISWQSFHFVIEEFESNLISPVLYIPVYPFVAMVAIAFFVLMLVLIEQFISSLVEIAS